MMDTKSPFPCASLLRNTSLLYFFVVLLAFNLITTSFYAQKTSFSRIAPLKTTSKSNSHSGEDITSIALDLEVLRPDQSSSTTPDFSNNAADFITSFVSIQKKIQLGSSYNIPKNVIHSRLSNPRAPPFVLA